MGDDGWAWADLGDCRGLVGDLTEAARAYSTFKDKAGVQAPAVTLEVLQNIADALTKRADSESGSRHQHDGDTAVVDRRRRRDGSAMNGESLAQAIAAEWERIAAAVGSALAEFEAELTRRLRELESRGDAAETINAIFALFDRHSEARAILRESLARTGANVAKGGERPSLLEQRVRYTTIPVLFGTSRAPTGRSNPAECFGTSRAENSFGIVNVAIPDDHRMGGSRNRAGSGCSSAPIPRSTSSR